MRVYHRFRYYLPTGESGTVHARHTLEARAKVTELVGPTDVEVLRALA